MRKPRIGLLPLYIMLYEETSPDLRPGLEKWATELTSRIAQEGIEVTVAPTARTVEETEQGVEFFRQPGIDLLVTLHLAYSPSMMSAPVLAGTEWPLLLLDTTKKAQFDESAVMRDMSENHGIHGVQDLSCMLRRLGRDYVVLAGHPDVSDVLKELADWSRAAQALSLLKNMRTALIGSPFKGMGDFAVEFDKLRERFGIEVMEISLPEIALAASEITPDEINAERNTWRKRFAMADVAEAPMEATLRSCLGLRKCLASAGCGSMTMNFQAFTKEAGVPTVPFIEASLAMERGAGYAGEGDVMTASFVGALNQAYGETSFTEMFCADWKGGTVFMSHMGECNTALAADKPVLIEKDYRFSDVANPLVAVFKLRPGPAVLVNPAPGPDGSFGIVAARVEVVDRGPAENFKHIPHFWIKPRNMDTARFLQLYSGFGGTHHSAIIMGERMEDIRKFATLAGMEFHQVC